MQPLYYRLRGTTELREYRPLERRYGFDRYGTYAVLYFEQHLSREQHTCATQDVQVYDPDDRPIVDRHALLDAFVDDSKRRPMSYVLLWMNPGAKGDDKAASTPLDLATWRREVCHKCIPNDIRQVIFSYLFVPMWHSMPADTKLLDHLESMYRRLLPWDEVHVASSPLQFSAAGGTHVKTASAEVLHLHAVSSLDTGSSNCF